MNNPLVMVVLVIGAAVLLIVLVRGSAGIAAFVARMLRAEPPRPVDPPETGAAKETSATADKPDRGRPRRH